MHQSLVSQSGLEVGGMAEQGPPGQGAAGGEDDGADPLDAFMTGLQAPAVPQVRIVNGWWRIGLKIASVCVARPTRAQVPLCPKSLLVEPGSGQRRVRPLDPINPGDVKIWKPIIEAILGFFSSETLSKFISEIFLLSKGLMNRTQCHAPCGVMLSSMDSGDLNWPASFFFEKGLQTREVEATIVSELATFRTIRPRIQVHSMLCYTGIRVWCIDEVWSHTMANVSE